MLATSLRSVSEPLQRMEEHSPLQITLPSQTNIKLKDPTQRISNSKCLMRSEDPNSITSSLRKVQPHPLPLPSKRLCRNPVHGSTSSPRTDYSSLEINDLAVRPEPVEGQTADYDTVSKG
jgi:hypothetical protein